MGVKLDWIDDLEGEDWPRRQRHEPPRRQPVPRWLRWLALAGVALVVGMGFSFWRLSDSGKRAAQEDVQEALAYGDWALAQGAEEVYRQHLDPADPQWQEWVLTQWEALRAASERQAPAQVESLRLVGRVAEAILQWQDRESGQAYRVRRWFRLADGEWRWTRPRADSWGTERRLASPHLDLLFHEPEADLADAVLAELDAYVAGFCQRYGLDEDGCHFSLSWELLGPGELPLTLRDLPLPPLASFPLPREDLELYVVGARSGEWHSARLGQWMRIVGAETASSIQTALRLQRPTEQIGLTEDLLGDPSQPILLPTPWLHGVNEEGWPHGQWWDHAKRLLADAILRRAEGGYLGPAEFVNGAWAVHMALLTMEAGPVGLDRLAPTGPAAPIASVTLQMPGLASLGAALQSAPDSLALAQLADLVLYLQETWPAEALPHLAIAMGRTGSIDALMQETLDLGEMAFLEGWRARQLGQADSPLSGLMDELVTHMRDEATARSSSRSLNRPGSPLGRLYTEAGRQWLGHLSSGSVVTEEPQLTEDWQVDIMRTGSAGEVVWVELVERDGERALADLRFYRQVAEDGWLRDAPDPDFWGAPDSLDTDLVHWRFHQADRELIELAAPGVEDDLRQVKADLSLDLQPITITVMADTAAWDFDATSVQVPSPRRYRVDQWPSAQDSLRYDASLRMILQQVMRKLNTVAVAGDSSIADQSFIVVFGAFRAELERRQIDTGSLFEELDGPLVAAVRSGVTLDLSQILSAAVDEDALWTGGYIQMIVYVLTEQGWQWLDQLFQQGLEQTLADIKAAQQWDDSQLQADWQRFLEQRYGGGS